MAFEPNDNELVFTLPEALIEIRDLRAQRDQLREALKIAKRFIEPHPSWESEARREAALVAVSTVR